MIPGLDPIAVSGLPFLVLGLVVVLAAWHGGARAFRWALPAASLVMAASWLDWPATLGLGAFVLPPYVAIRWAWGRGAERTRGLVPLLASALVAAFVVLRGYDFVPSSLAHPLAIVGLSYILFRILHLAIEAPEASDLPPGPLEYLVYLLAFWTLLAGPIQTWPDHKAALAGVGRPPADRALAAGHRAVNGAIKAFLLAPLLRHGADLSLPAQGGAVGGLDWVVAFYAYPAFLYLNFSGYSDVMIGLARLSGFELPENFNRPYLARNVQDFWNRWHMSLSAWIRAYVFLPLTRWAVVTGGRGRELPMTLLAILLTFAVVGGWHGTGVNFIAFGLVHGLGVATCSLWDELLKKRLGKSRRKAFVQHWATRAVATVLCFHFVCASMLLINDTVPPARQPLTAWLY
jgi:D-alanyl-lipoteichoic acid acyltransferase DltB (MBOAT superfamily)